MLYVVKAILIKLLTSKQTPLNDCFFLIGFRYTISARCQFSSTMLNEVCSILFVLRLRVLNDFSSNVSIVIILLIYIFLMLFSIFNNLQKNITTIQWNLVPYFESRFVSIHYMIVLLIFCECVRLITHCYCHLVIWTFLDRILLRLMVLFRLLPTCTTHIVLYELMVGNFNYG